MADPTPLVDPRRITPNPENPRLIFRQDDLQSLQDSIKLQGILVPLTVFRDGAGYVILDGERRWRCAVKLGLPRVPVIVQPKPDRLQNIMMMFAIHDTRSDWDPLPTAYELQDLEGEFMRRQGRSPTEAELAELASLSRGSSGLTKAQAEARLRKLMSETTYVAPDERLAFGDVAQRYVDHVEHVMGRKPSTVRDYRIIVGKHLGPYFGGKAISRITSDDVAAYLTIKAKEGLSPKTISNHLTLAHGVLQFAVKRGLAPIKPVAAVDRPKPADANPEGGDGCASHPGGGIVRPGMRHTRGPSSADT